MSTPTTDAPQSETPAETPVVDLTVSAADSCSICTRALKHCDVVLLGKNKEDQNITVHPECLTNDSPVKSLNMIHVHVAEGKTVSPAKRLVIQKRIKALYKAIAIANAKRAAEETGQSQ